MSNPGEHKSTTAGEDKSPPWTIYPRRLPPRFLQARLVLKLAVNHILRNVFPSLSTSRTRSARISQAPGIKAPCTIYAYEGLLSVGKNFLNLVGLPESLLSIVPRAKGSLLGCDLVDMECCSKNCGPGLGVRDGDSPAESDI
jgi:hypothetical protein